MHWLQDKLSTSLSQLTCCTLKNTGNFIYHSPLSASPLLGVGSRSCALYIPANHKAVLFTILELFEKVFKIFLQPLISYQIWKTNINLACKLINTIEVIFSFFLYKWLDLNIFCLKPSSNLWKSPLKMSTNSVSKLLLLNQLFLVSQKTNIQMQTIFNQ